MNDQPGNSTPKPELTLLNLQNVTAEALDALSERLTGRKVTAEEHARSVALAQELNSRLARRTPDAESGADSGTSS